MSDSCYRVISATPCRTGPISTTQCAAWDGWQRRNGIDDADVLATAAASNATLVAATSRKAIRRADLSVPRGLRWWRVSYDEKNAA